MYRTVEEPTLIHRNVHARNKRALFEYYLISYCILTAIRGTDAGSRDLVQDALRPLGH